MAARYLLPALAIAGRAAAEICSGTTTIQSQAEATQIATCEQWTGDIWIGAKTTEDIDLSGIQRIEGSLFAKDVPGMTSLSADTLSIISKTFGLLTISALTSLNFPSLVAVDQIYWEGLPNLQGLSFTQQVQTASVLSIQNTNLYTLEGIDLQMIDALYIENNLFLDDINMQLGNVTQLLVITSNGRNTQVSFPNLLWAYNMTIQNVASLDIASLAYVNGSLGFRSNTFEEIQAPNLTAVGQSLSFAANPGLKTIDFPELTEINGGIVIANNTGIQTIDGFPRLSKIFGNIDFTGDFKSASLPKLSYVQGAFNMASSKNIQSSCNTFQKLHDSSDIRGNFSCIPNDEGAATKGAPDSGSGGGSSSGGSSSGGGHNGAGSLLIPYATGIICVVAAMFGML